MKMPITSKLNLATSNIYRTDYPTYYTFVEPLNIVDLLVTSNSTSSPLVLTNNDGTKENIYPTINEMMSINKLVKGIQQTPTTITSINYVTQEIDLKGKTINAVREGYNFGLSFPRLKANELVVNFSYENNFNDARGSSCDLYGGVDNLEKVIYDNPNQIPYADRRDFTYTITGGIELESISVRRHYSQGSNSVHPRSLSVTFNNYEFV